MKREPKTLQEAIIYFADPDNCMDYLVVRRWPNGVTCPTCGADKPTFLKNQRKWQCRAKHSMRTFTLKTGTIFADSPIGLDKWLLATWMVTNCKNGVSSYEIYRDIDVTQKTAWFMLHRIRLAMQGDGGGAFDGEVEMDETYIGGLARNMHKKDRARKIHGRTGGLGKTAVFGLLERGKDGKKSRVHAQVIPDNWKRDDVRGIIGAGVAKETAKVYTDEHSANHYLGSEGFHHEFVSHAEYYVNGAVHTNGIENFWSLLKRGIRGTDVSFEPFHMFRYLDEQAFRFNERFGDDSERFSTVIKQIVGKRVTYKQLTGNTDETPRQPETRI